VHKPWKTLQSFGSQLACLANKLFARTTAGHMQGEWPSPCAHCCGKDAEGRCVGATTHGGSRGVGRRWVAPWLGTRHRQGNLEVVPGPGAGSLGAEPGHSLAAASSDAAGAGWPCPLRRHQGTPFAGAEAASAHTRGCVGGTSRRQCWTYQISIQYLIFKGRNPVCIAFLKLHALSCVANLDV
jgi:hypothetical protein